MSPYSVPTPDSPYGANKIFMESLGRYYAKNGIEVVCIRFMGLNRENQSPKDPEDRKRFCSHRDCASLVRAAIEAPAIPNNYTIIYCVSNNTNRIHDFTNPFGWMPQDNADKM